MRHVRVICYLRRIQSRNALSALTALVMAVAVSADATLAVAAGDASYENPPATIEVRIWQDLQNACSIHVSARQVGGSWDSLGIIRLALDDGLSSTGMFGYGDIALDVPLQDWASPATIEVRVWQHLLDQRNMYISARGSRGSWAALGTILLPLDHGVHRGLGYRYGDISIDAPQPPGGVVSLAGRARVRGYREGHGEEARFGRHDEATIGLAVDDDGSVVVADFRNAAIRRISPDGIVTTIAGGNGRGLLDGPGEVARFEAPDDVAIDYEGAIYVADSRAHRIRKITPDGVVTTVAGTDQPRPERWIHRDGRAGGALFIAPSGIAIDPNGDIYITEQTRIRRLSPSGWVTTYAGAAVPGYRDGPRDRAQFSHIRAMDVDAEGSVYLLDTISYVPGRDGTHYAVRKIDASGWVSTLYMDGPPQSGGLLVAPAGIAVTEDAEIYVTNTGRNQIARVEGRHRLVAVAGTGEDGYLAGPRDAAILSNPGALEILPGGALLVADQGDSLIRVVIPDADGTFSAVPTAVIPEVARVEGVRVSAVAGVGGFARYVAASGFLDGPASQALFSSPYGIALEADGSIIVADAGNDAIRRISPDGDVRTVTGGNGRGDRDGPRDAAQFSRPRGIVVDAEGVIYVADTDSGLLRKVASDGAVTTVTSRIKTLYRPTALAFDPHGNLLFSERGRIHRFSPEGPVSVAVDEGNGFIRGLAADDEGTVFYVLTRGSKTFIRKAGRDGLPVTVFEDRPGHFGGIFSTNLPGLALATDGTLYAADWQYGRVVEISSGGEAAIVVDRARFNDAPRFQPAAIVVAPEGHLLVADSGNSVIWKITIGPGGDE